MSEKNENKVEEWFPPENVTETEMRIVALRTNCEDMRPVMQKSVDLYDGLENVPMEIVEVAYKQLKRSVDLSGPRGDAYPNLTQEDWKTIKEARDQQS